MNADRLKFSISRTVSANYNSVHVEVGIESDREPDEPIQDGYKRLEKECTLRLRRTIKRLREDLEQ